MTKVKEIFNDFFSLVWGFREILLMAIAFIAIAATIFVIPTWLIWRWVVPDVFSGAVQANILPGRITLWEAFKLNVFLGILFTKFSFFSSKED